MTEALALARVSVTCGVLLSCGRTTDSASVGRQWTLYEENLAVEIYGGGVDSKGSFFTSGANDVWMRGGGRKEKVYSESIKLGKLWIDRADVVWAVGSRGDDSGRVIRCVAQRCEQSAVLKDVPLRGVSGTDEGEIFVCGSVLREHGVVAGSVQRSVDGVNFASVYEQDGYFLDDVWASPGGECVWAVGRSQGGEFDRGLIVSRGADGVWEDITFAPNDFIYSDVWGTAPNEVFIVGQASSREGWLSGSSPLSVVLAWNGESLLPVLTHDAYNLMAIGGNGPGRLLFGGTLRDPGAGGHIGGVAILDWDQRRLVPGRVAGNHEVTDVLGFALSPKDGVAFAYATEGEIYRAAWRGGI